MRHCTLCLLIRDDKVLLAYKNKGLNTKIYNGYGGHKKPNETIEEAAVRELKEEAQVKVNQKDLKSYGKLKFEFMEKPDWNQWVYIFKVMKWKGTPKESKDKEMLRPEWFEFLDVPYSNMWDGDKYWLPHVLYGDTVEGEFLFDGNQKVKSYRLDLKDKPR